MQNSLVLREVTDRGVGYELGEAIIGACLRADNGQVIGLTCKLESITEKREAIAAIVTKCDKAISDAVNFTANDRSLLLQHRVKMLDKLYEMVFDALANEKARVETALTGKRPGWVFSVKASRKPTRRDGGDYGNMDSPLTPETDLTVTCRKLQDHESEAMDLLARLDGLEAGKPTITRKPDGSEKPNGPAASATK